jgi:Ca2+:H+ antiporter
MPAGAVVNKRRARQRLANGAPEPDPENGLNEKHHPIPPLTTQGLVRFADRFLRRGKRHIGVRESLYNIATSSCGRQILGQEL